MNDNTGTIKNIAGRQNEGIPKVFQQNKVSKQKSQEVQNT